MTAPPNLPPPQDDLPDETPEALAGIAERMQKAIDELFAVKAEAAELAKSGKLPDEVERVLSAAALDEKTPSAIASGAETAEIDRRLYLPSADGWEVRVKSGPRDYCFYRNPGEEWFHLLIDGELYLQFGEQKICLNCAFRQGILTGDRLFWQTGHRRRRIAAIEATASPLQASPEESTDLGEPPIAAQSTST